jgi:hypothetical protein
MMIERAREAEIAEAKKALKKAPKKAPKKEEAKEEELPFVLPPELPAKAPAKAKTPEKIGFPLTKESAAAVAFRELPTGFGKFKKNKKK